MAQAIPYLTKAVDLKPQDDTVLNNRGVAYYMKNNFNKAHELFTKASGQPALRNLVPLDNLRRLNMHLKDNSYKPNITCTALIRP